MNQSADDLVTEGRRLLAAVEERRRGDRTKFLAARSECQDFAYKHLATLLDAIQQAQINNSGGNDD